MEELDQAELRLPDAVLGPCELLAVELEFAKHGKAGFMGSLAGKNRLLFRTSPFSCLCCDGAPALAPSSDV